MVIAHLGITAGFLDDTGIGDTVYSDAALGVCHTGEKSGGSECKECLLHYFSDSLCVILTEMSVLIRLLMLAFERLDSIFIRVGLSHFDKKRRVGIY